MSDQATTDPSVDPRVRALASRLASRPALQDAADDPETDSAGPGPIPFASVALVVRPRPSDLEALLIRRATFDGDPWSGHVALPGGRRAPGDRTTLETAIRETREEVGIDLAGSGIVLGRLDDVRPRRGAPLVSVSAHVFAVPPDTGVTLNYEVESALWVPVSHLADTAAAIEHVHTMSSGEAIPFPAIGYRDFVIWGLTHSIVTQFCRVVPRAAEEWSD